MAKRLLLLVGFLLICASCKAAVEIESSSTLTIAPPLNPYQSITDTPQIPTATVPLPTAQPLIPTPTPFLHAVEPGETLYGIALKYNITLDDLVLANPGINTSALSIGTELVIPPSEDDQTVPTPTPFPVSLGEPTCYETQDGGLWCYLLVENDQNLALEDISLAFNFFVDPQELVQSVIAIPPLNLLFPGQSIPAGAWIEDPPEDWTGLTASLLTAFPADIEEPAVEITDYAVTYSQEHTIAEVSGTYEIKDLQAAGSQVWIAGIAFNEDSVAGVRKWASGQDLAAETPYEFEFQIYSLGPRIDQVQLLGELH
jgi:LysM repeat protein